MRHKFRRLLERHNLGDRLFARIAEYLQENGLKVSTGTIVDATIISAPSSTKNRDEKRDPERYQTRKGNRHQPLTDTERAKNRSKSRVCAKVELRSRSSSGYLVSASSVTEAWTKTPTGWSWPAGW